MCTSPIHIKNKTKGYKKGYTKSELYVPCGQCDECRSVKADQWHLRIVDTIREYEAVGGASIFVTFTYDEDNLPRYYYKHDDGTTKSFPCFSKIHKDQCLNKIRDYFRYHFRHRPTINGRDQYNIPTYTEMPVRYIWTSEYGLDIGRTMRSHYHVIFNIPPRLLAEFGRSEQKWKKFFRDMWPYGMTRFSPNNSIFINSEFAGLYVSKYINKNVDFYKQKDVQVYFDQAKDANGKYDKERYKALKDAVSDILPHHWQSTYYGAKLQAKFDNLDVFCNGLDFKFVGEIQKGQKKLHPCPQYIERRMLCTRDKETASYVLTEKGYEWKTKKFEVTSYKKADDYNKLLDKRHLRFLIKDDDIFRTNKYLKRFGNIDSLYDYITSILVKVSTSLELVMYNRVWSDVVVHDPGQLHWLDSLSYPQFLEESIKRYYESLYLPYDDYIEEGYFSVHSPDDIGLYNFNDCKRFRGYKEALDVFGAVYGEYNKFVQAHYNDDYVKNKNNKFNIKTA